MEFDLGLIHTQNLTWDGYFMIEVFWGNKKETKVAATSFLSRRTI